MDRLFSRRKHLDAVLPINSDGDDSVASLEEIPSSLSSSIASPITTENIPDTPHERKTFTAQIKALKSRNTASSDLSTSDTKEPTNNDKTGKSNLKKEIGDMILDKGNRTKKDRQDRPTSAKFKQIGLTMEVFEDIFKWLAIPLLILSFIFWPCMILFVMDLLFMKVVGDSWKDDFKDNGDLFPIQEKPLIAELKAEQKAAKERQKEIDEIKKQEKLKNVVQEAPIQVPHEEIVDTTTTLSDDKQKPQPLVEELEQA